MVDSNLSPEELLALKKAKIKFLRAKTPLWPAPFNEDTPECAHRFLLNLRTWNEAEGEIQPFPDKPYIRPIIDDYFRVKEAGGTIIIEKCRRMIVSWLFRGLELHQLGLRRSDMFLGGDDYEAAAKHVWRLDHYYQDLRKRFPSWNLADSKIGRYEGNKKFKSFELSNGSTCEAVNGESGNVQGDGRRIITFEEFPLYRNPSGMLSQSKIITQGSPGNPGGVVCCIGNASPNYEWQIIKWGGDDKPPELDQTETRGLERIVLPTGAIYLKLHHYADPNKQDDWLERVRMEMADTPEDFEREILMKEDSYGGMAVFPTYDDSTHSADYIDMQEPGDWLYFGGWDCGQTLSPAFVLKRVNAATGRVQAVHERMSIGGESMDEFAPKVKSDLEELLGPEKFKEVKHYADATVETRNGSNKRTARDEAREFGMDLHPISNVWEGRKSAVTWLLGHTTTAEETGFVISRKACPILRKGFQGAYKYKLSASGDMKGPGAVILKPDKNSYSHMADANQYVDVAIRALLSRDIPQGSIKRGSWVDPVAPRQIGQSKYGNEARLAKQLEKQREAFSKVELTNG